MLNDMAKTMNRVQKLLAKAEDPACTPAEADALYEKADQLMREYKIAQEDLIAQDPFSIVPISSKIFIAPAHAEFFIEIFMMMDATGHHTGVRWAEGWDELDGMRGYIATVVGYDIDLRYMEYLFSQARLVFGRHLEPKFDPELSEQENIYMMRQAGMLRKDIALRMWGDNTSSLRSKAQRLYIKECEKRGEQPALEGLGTDAKAFRAAYARSFVEEYQRRLRMARQATNARGGEVLLAGRDERVREAFYEMFPERRPKPPTTLVVEVDLTEKPKKAPKPKGPTKAQMRRMDRMYYSSAAKAGEGRGRTAAQQVDISRQEQNVHLEGGDN